MFPKKSEIPNQPKLPEGCILKQHDDPTRGQIFCQTQGRAESRIFRWWKETWIQFCIDDPNHYYPAGGDNGLVPGCMHHPPSKGKLPDIDAHSHQLSVAVSLPSPPLPIGMHSQITYRDGAAENIGMSGFPNGAAASSSSLSNSQSSLLCSRNGPIGPENQPYWPATNYSDIGNPVSLVDQLFTRLGYGFQMMGRLLTSQTWGKPRAVQVCTTK